MAADPCEPFAAAMQLLERRWAAAAVRAMLDGAERFGEIRSRMPSVTDAVLSSRLRELCSWGIVIRHEPRPGEVRYRLTDVGRDLEPVLTSIERFGQRHQPALAEISAARSSTPSDRQL